MMVVPRIVFGLPKPFFAIVFVRTVRINLKTCPDHICSWSGPTQILQNAYRKNYDFLPRDALVHFQNTYTDPGTTYCPNIPNQTFWHRLASRGSTNSRLALFAPWRHGWWAPTTQHDALASGEDANNKNYRRATRKHSWTCIMHCQEEGLELEPKWIRTAFAIPPEKTTSRLPGFCSVAPETKTYDWQYLKLQTVHPRPKQKLVVVLSSFSTLG